MDTLLTLLFLFLGIIIVPWDIKQFLGINLENSPAPISHFTEFHFFSIKNDFGILLVCGLFAGIVTGATVNDFLCIFDIYSESITAYHSPIINAKDQLAEFAEFTLSGREINFWTMSYGGEIEYIWSIEKGSQVTAHFWNACWGIVTLSMLLWLSLSYLS